MFKSDDFLFGPQCDSQPWGSPAPPDLLIKRVWDEPLELIFASAGPPALRHSLAAVN